MTILIKSTWIKWLLLMAGIIEILVGFIHFIMPMFVYKSPGLSLLSRSEISFINLSVYAIGILLIAFGVLTIFVSFKTELWRGLLLPFLLVKSILWSARVGLEMLLPVAVPLFYFDRPSTVVMPLLVLEALLFIAPAVYVWNQKVKWDEYTT